MHKIGPRAMERILAARPEETEVVCDPCLPGAEQFAYHSAPRKVAARCDIIVSLEVGEARCRRIAPKPRAVAPSERSRRTTASELPAIRRCAGMRYTAPLRKARRSIARPLHYEIRQGEL